MPTLAELMSGAVKTGLEDTEGQQRRLQTQKSQQDQALKEYLLGKQISEAQRLRQQYGPEVGVNVEGVSIQPKDQLRAAQLRALQEERDLKALKDVREEAQQTGIAQVQPAMQRLETAAPGSFTGQAKFKSVGGMKNMIPNALVSPAEAFGILPKGAAEERAALQELANVKIYDSSGKQINEAEMRRIQDAMGLRGISDPTVLTDALKQQGYQVVSKQQQIAAGTKPSAMKAFKQAGGVGGYTKLEEILTGGPGGGARQPASAQQPKTPVKKEYSASRDQTRITYSDGSQEMVSGKH